MHKITQGYMGFIVACISIGYFCTGTAASELAGVTESSPVRTTNTEWRGPRGQAGSGRGTTASATALDRTQHAVLKNRLQNRSASQYGAREDTSNVSPDAYNQLLHGEAERLRRRWSGWTSHKRLEEAMRLVAATRPADNDSQDKVGAWRNFQARLIRESTRPPAWLEDRQ